MAEASGNIFDIAHVRVIIEGIDQASEPIRKVKEQVNDLSKEQEDIFPKKVMETMTSGWMEVGLAITGVVGAFYGLIKYSPIFGSYVSMFFQSLGALIDTIIAPAMPLLDAFITKMWDIVTIAQNATRTINALYHEALQITGFESKDSGAGAEGLKPGQVGSGIGGVVGGVLGGVAAGQALIGLGAAGMAVPAWQAKLLGVAMIALGALAGGHVGSDIENDLSNPKQNALDRGSMKIGNFTAGIRTNIEKGLDERSTKIAATETKAEISIIINILNNNTENIITQVNKALREKFKGLSSGSGIV